MHKYTLPHLVGGLGFWICRWCFCTGGSPGLAGLLLSSSPSLGPPWSPPLLVSCHLQTTRNEKKVVFDHWLIDWGIMAKPLTPYSQWQLSFIKYLTIMYQLTRAYMKMKPGQGTSRCSFTRVIFRHFTVTSWVKCIKLVARHCGNDPLTIMSITAAWPQPKMTEVSLLLKLKLEMRERRIKTPEIYETQRRLWQTGGSNDIHLCLPLSKPALNHHAV